MGQQGLAAEGPEEVPWLRGWPSQQVGEVLPQVQDEPGALPSCWQGGSHYGEEPLRSHADSRSSGQAYQQAPRNSCCSRCSRRKGCPEHAYFKEDYVQGASREVLSGIDGGLECGLGSECRRYARL